ncbi:MAG: serine hydrolase domain-containing protein [Pseudomonadales bacterium]
MALLAAMLAAMPGTASTAPLPQPDARWHAMAADLERLARAENVPALTLVVLDSGRPVLFSAMGMTPDTPFRWGSITKTVTALTLLELAREHGLDLDGKVVDMLPAAPYRNPWAATAPMRLAHLLELSAGLPDLTRDEFRTAQGEDLGAALYPSAQQRPVLWPPGLQHSYSNVPPAISAAVIEQLTGADFESQVRRLVFQPLAMTHASLLPVSGLPGGFEADGRTPIPYWDMRFRAFGALNTSPRELARLLAALLDHGRVGGRQALAESSVARAYRVETGLTAEAGLRIGYGAGLYGWISQGRLFHGHGGDADGYLSRFGLLPEAGRGYLLGINSDNPPLLRRLQRRVETALAADLAAPTQPPELRLDPAALTRLAGEWYPSATRFDVARWRSGEAQRGILTVRDGHLLWQRGTHSQQLMAVADNLFRRAGDPLATIAFVRRDGVLYLQGELGNFVRVRPGPCPGFLAVCDPQ